MFVQMDAQAVECPASRETHSIVVAQAPRTLAAPVAVNAPRVSLASPTSWLTRVGSVERLAMKPALEGVSTMVVAGLLYVWTLAVLVGAW